MIKGMTFDEINELVGINRSVPYESYFGEMSISEDDKRHRIEMANAFEDAFLITLSLLFTMQQYGAVDWEQVRRSFENGYRSVLDRYITSDEYLMMRAESFGFDATDSTRNHSDEPYYYSIDRAMYMAENESNTVLNYDDYSRSIKEGKKRKRWVSIQDEMTRTTHRDIDYTEIPIDGIFRVGGSLMRFPKDTSLGASPEEIINCRCSILYI